MNLLDIWHAWWSGDQVNDMILWGHTVRFWGRVGKMLEFGAGLTVLLDIIGTDRLRVFGEAKARDRAAHREVFNAHQARRKEIAARWHELMELRTDDSRMKAAIYALKDSISPLDQIMAIVASFTPAMLVSMILLCAGNRDGETHSVIWALNSMFLIPGVIILFDYLTPYTRLLRAGVAAARASVAHSISEVFFSANPGRPIRIVALPIFLVGFIFDLLSS